MVPGGMMKLGQSPGSLRSAIALAVCVLASASAGLATDLDMAQIPVTSPNLCLTCHTSENPGPGDFELNLFGVDFLANGRLWDSTLAQLDSDDDGCLNGVEVGDSDGDGQPDGNVDEQAGNPGVHDECGAGSLVDERTWGALKAMFDGR
jgi:hypothetical protein